MAERGGLNVIHVVIAVAAISVTLFLAVVVMLGIGIFLPALGKARQSAMQLKDGTQVRAIMQASSIFAQDNRGTFPIPSLLDAGNTTEAADVDKDRTGSVLSALCYQQVIMPEICVSPAELGQVKVHQGYNAFRPMHALDPAAALYDPTMKGSPRDVAGIPLPDQGFGHNSYAHSSFAGARRQLWRDNFSGATPIWANRGPVYTGTIAMGTGPTGHGSDANKLFGKTGQWEGNVAFGDGRVVFTLTASSQGASYMNASGRVPDNIFYDEADELADSFDKRRNAYLRIWKRGIPADDVFSPAHHDETGDFVWVDGQP